MDADPETPVVAPASAPRRELGMRARAIGVVVWSSFLAACAGTMFFFAFIAPPDIAGAAEGGWQDHLGIYTLGFFGLWCLGAAASAIALYLYGVVSAPRDAA